MKNIPALSMAIIVAKAEKRAQEEAKETVFFHSGMEVKLSQIERFMRRGSKFVKAVSPGPGNWSTFGVNG